MLEHEDGTFEEPELEDHVEEEAYFAQEQFLELLRDNKVPIPNDFLKEMGERIRKTREELGITQSDLAKKLKRRQAAVSEIENGKTEIGILTLLQFAVVLNKPISFFFSETLLKEWLVEVKTPFQHKCLDHIRYIEQFEGDEEMILDLLKSLEDHFHNKYLNSMEEDQSLT